MEEDNQWLERPFEEDEIKMAVFELEEDKSPSLMASHWAFSRHNQARFIGGLWGIL